MANKAQLDQIAFTLAAVREYRERLTEFLTANFSSWSMSVNSLDRLRAELTDAADLIPTGSTAMTRYGVTLVTQFNQTIPPTPFFAFWRQKLLLKKAISDVNILFAKALETPLVPPFEAFRPNSETELHKTILFMLQYPESCRDRSAVFFKSMPDPIHSDTRSWRTRWICGSSELYMLWQIEKALQSSLELYTSTAVPSTNAASQHSGVYSVIFWVAASPRNPT